MRFQVSIALGLSAIAVTTAIPTGSGGGNCNVGGVQCCNSLHSANSQGAAALLGILGVILGPIGSLVGLGCSPITVIGAAGSSCDVQPVCCEHNQFNGLINFGCSPVNVNV